MVSPRGLQGPYFITLNVRRQFSQTLLSISAFANDKRVPHPDKPCDFDYMEYSDIKKNEICLRFPLVLRLFYVFFQTSFKLVDV